MFLNQSGVYLVKIIILLVFENLVINNNLPNSSKNIDQNCMMVINTVIYKTKILIPILFLVYIIT